MQNLIAKRAAQELKSGSVVNLGIGIPTLVANHIADGDIFFHTENGLLGVTDVNEADIDPNIVNAGKLPVGEAIGASYFNSAESFAMIRGQHVDVAILGVLQVDAKGLIANWAVPGKILWVWGCNGFTYRGKENYCDHVSYIQRWYEQNFKRMYLSNYIHKKCQFNYYRARCF